MSPSPAMGRRRRTGTPRTKMPAKSVALLAASHPKRPDTGLNAPDTVWAAVVLSVSVDVPEAFGTELKLNPQIGAGVPPPVTLLHASATAPVKPPVGAMVMVEVAVPPAETVAGASTGAVIVKPGADTFKLTDVLWLAPEVPVTVMLEVVSGVFEFVLTVRVDVPDAFSEPGEKAQLAPTGRLADAQVRVTVPLNPCVADTVIVEVPDCPGAGTVTGVPPIEKSGVVIKPGHDVRRTLASTDPRPVTRS